MDLLDMYKIIDKEKIDCNEYDCGNKSKARIFEIDNNYSIAINHKNIEGIIEEKEILAEELRTLLL